MGLPTVIVATGERALEFAEFTYALAFQNRQQWLHQVMLALFVNRRGNYC